MVANKISAYIDTKKHKEDYYVDKERMILVQGISLKICLTQDYFDSIKAGEIIFQDDSQKWLQEVVVGNIQKLELDTERMVETNSLDLMQNTNVIYHPESVIEFQVLCLLMCKFFHGQWAKQFLYNTENNLLMNKFLAEHIMSYFIDIFRHYEIKKHGEQDERGVQKANIESKLNCLQILIRVVLAVWGVIHMTTITEEEFYAKPFLHYWIYIDIIIMMFMIPYMNLCHRIMIKGEIMKNIFTLYQVQRAKLRQRRECGDYECWKSFFTSHKNKDNKKKVFKHGLYTIDELKSGGKKKKHVGIQDEDNTSGEESGTDSDSLQIAKDQELRDTARRSIIIMEEDYQKNERINFSADAYNYTICANMTHFATITQ